MKISEILLEINRRDFLKGTAGAAITSMLPTKKASASAQWIEFAHATDGSTVYFDNQSLKYDSGIYTAWFKFDGGKHPGTYKVRVNADDNTWQTSFEGYWSDFEEIAPSSITDLFLDYMKYMKKRNLHLDSGGTMRPNKP